MFAPSTETAVRYRMFLVKRLPDAIDFVSEGMLMSIARLRIPLYDPLEWIRDLAAVRTRLIEIMQGRPIADPAVAAAIEEDIDVGEDLANLKLKTILALYYVVASRNIENATTEPLFRKQFQTAFPHLFVMRRPPIVRWDNPEDVRTAARVFAVIDRAVRSGTIDLTATEDAEHVRAWLEHYLGVCGTRDAAAAFYDYMDERRSHIDDELAQTVGDVPIAQALRFMFFLMASGRSHPEMAAESRTAADASGERKRAACAANVIASAFGLPHPVEAAAPAEAETAWPIPRLRRAILDGVETLSAP